jgi:ribosome-binding factor A
MTDGRRPRRVAEGIREYLGGVISTELSDPRLNGLVITRVEVTADLGIADVYFRVMLAKPAAQERAVQSLTRAAGRLRRGIGTRVQTKRTPELRFFYDSAPDARARVDALLSEIKEESGYQPDAQAAEPESPAAGERVSAALTPDRE